MCITQSEQVDQIAMALAEAQAEMEPAGKNANAPVGKEEYGKIRKYADLASVFDVLRKVLPKNGLAVTQAVLPFDDGKAHVRTTLLHKSGQWLAGECVMPCDRQGGIQGMGSAISYARRYGLSALLGVVSDEDDDGKAAQGAGQQRQPNSPPARQGQQQPRPQQQGQRRPAQGASSQNPPQQTPPVRHVGLEEAQWEFTTCNSVEALHARAKELNIQEDNPEYNAILAAYKARLADLKAMPGNGTSSQQGEATGAKLSPGQRTAIMTHYSKRGMADAAYREARLKDLSDFLGRPIGSVNDLGAAEAADFLNALNQTKPDQEAA